MKNKIIIFLALIIILGVIFRKQLSSWFLRKESEGFTKDEAEMVVLSNVDMLEGVTLIDGSVYTESFYEQYRTTAESLANGQLYAMDNNWTDVYSLLAPLVCLTGAELLCVYRAFGSKVYQQSFGSDMNLNLFQWYGKETCTTGWLGGCQDAVFVFSDEEIEDCNNYGCSSWWSQCYGAYAVGTIWYKAGLDVSAFTDVCWTEQEAVEGFDNPDYPNGYGFCGG